MLPIWYTVHMTEAELKHYMREYGWTFVRRARRDKVYVYAVQQRDMHKYERYVCKGVDIALLTVDSVKEKLS